MILFSIIATAIADVIWGGKLLGQFQTYRRVVAPALVLAAFALIFPSSWILAGSIATIAFTARRLMGWRSYFTGKVFLPMTEFPLHPALMALHSMALLAGPIVGHFLGVEFEPEYLLLFGAGSIMIGCVYYIIIGLMKKSHHIAEIAAGSITGLFLFIYLSNALGVA